MSERGRSGVPFVEDKGAVEIDALFTRAFSGLPPKHSRIFSIPASSSFRLPRSIRTWFSGGAALGCPLGMAWRAHVMTLPTPIPEALCNRMTDAATSTRENDCLLCFAHWSFPPSRCPMHHIRCHFLLRDAPCFIINREMDFSQMQLDTVCYHGR